MHTTAQALAGRPMPIEPAPAEQGATKEQVVAELYDRGVLSRKQVSSAVAKLRLNLDKMARTLGYETRNEFLTEFVTSSDDRTLEDDGVGWTTWTFEEMKALVDLFYGERRTAAEVAEALGETNPARTYKSVKGFLRRTFEQGNYVDRYVWDLLQEGHRWEDISEAGYNSWRAEFTEQLHRLKRYCATVRGAHDPVILFRE